MLVYIYMGTHLPELRCCIEQVAHAAPRTDSPVEVIVPNGMEWAMDGTTLELVGYDPDTVLWVFDPDKEQSCHILVDPRCPLIPQLEKLAGNLRNCLIEPVKILTCVDCWQSEKSGKLRNWLDACIYYSDIVLLGNRSNASKPFIRDYQKGYERMCYPCLFMLLKGPGKPADVDEVLTPGTRRLSQMFELADAPGTTQPGGFVIESTCDLDLQEMESDPFRSPREDEPVRHIPDPSEFIVWAPDSDSKKP